MKRLPRLRMSSEEISTRLWRWKKGKRRGRNGAASLYTDPPRRLHRREILRTGTFFSRPPSYAALAVPRFCVCVCVFSFPLSFLTEAFTALAPAVINFATHHHDRCIDMRCENSGCLITTPLASLTAFYLFGIILDIDPPKN